MNCWLLAASAAVLAFTGAANAADMSMPTKMPVKAMAPVSYSWAGFYLGGYVGHGVNGTRATDPTGLLVGSIDFVGAGISGGVQAGYNFQINEWLAAGLEADFGALSINRGALNWNEALSYNSKTNWIATARARIGLTGNGTFGYVTAGGAAVDTEESTAVNVLGLTSTSRGTRFGYVIGTGKEVALSGAWSAKIEQLYVDVAAGGNNLVAGFNVQSGHHQYYINRFGVNYAFGAKNFMPTPGNWGGLYLGLVGGSGITDTAATETGPVFATNSQLTSNGTGYTLGGIAGFNWQAGHFVIGPEADYSWMNISRTKTDYNDLSPVALSNFMSRATWLATARARVGLSVGDALLYGTGGWGWAGVEDSWTRLTGATTGTVSRTASGLAVGGGIETKFWGNFTARTEYLYFDGGTSSVTSVLGGAGGTSTLSIDHKYHLFRGALTYRFGDMASPVVAKY